MRAGDVGDLELDSRIIERVVRRGCERAFAPLDDLPIDLAHDDFDVGGGQGIERGA